MVKAGTHVQWSKKGVRTLTLMPKPVRGGHDVSAKACRSPSHLWEALDQIAEIQTAPTKRWVGVRNTVSATR